MLSHGVGSTAAHNIVAGLPCDARLSGDATVLPGEFEVAQRLQSFPLMSPSGCSVLKFLRAAFLRPAYITCQRKLPVTVLAVESNGISERTMISLSYSVLLSPPLPRISVNILAGYPVCLEFEGWSFSKGCILF